MLEKPALSIINNFRLILPIFAIYNANYFASDFKNLQKGIFFGQELRVFFETNHSC